MAVSVTDGKRAAYLFPLLVPLITGLLLAFAKLLAGMAETSAMVLTGIVEDLPVVISVEQVHSLLRTDLISLWTGANEGIVVSMVVVDVWALTLLYASRSNPAPYAFVYPIVGMFLHFILILVVVALHQVADSFDVLMLTQSDSENLSMLAQSDSEESWWASMYRAIATLTTIFSVIVAIYVRHGIWRLHDSQEWALKVASKPNP